MRAPLKWYGGKGAFARWIVGLLPPHEIYVEPFFGAGSVFFAKEPARLETINDLNQDVVNFYRVLRDPDTYEDLARRCALTPYARAEYLHCREAILTETDPVERARQFWVVARFGYGGAGRAKHAGFSCATGVKVPSNGRVTSSVRGYLSAIDNLDQVHARLQNAQIDSRDWRAHLDQHAGERALIYLDPPYATETRSVGSDYRYEMTLTQHQELTAYLLDCPGMVVLSGYHHDPIHNPLVAAGWERIDRDVQLSFARNAPQITRTRRTETLWRNPAAVAAAAQSPLPMSSLYPPDTQSGDAEEEAA